MTHTTPTRSTRSSQHWMDPYRDPYEYTTSPSGTEYTNCRRCDSTFRTGPQCGCEPRMERSRSPRQRERGPQTPTVKRHPIIAITEEGRREEETARAENERVREQARARKERIAREAMRAWEEEMASFERAQEAARAKKTHQEALRKTSELAEQRRGDISPTQL